MIRKKVGNKVTVTNADFTTYVTIDPANVYTDRTGQLLVYTDYRVLCWAAGSWKGYILDR